MVTSATRGVTHGADLRGGAGHGDQPARVRGARRGATRRSSSTWPPPPSRPARSRSTSSTTSRCRRAGWWTATARPVTDPRQAFRYVFERPEGGITPLGGAREVGGHKGYGLAVMVHILGGTLAGASFSPIRNRTQQRRRTRTTSATSSWPSIRAPSATRATSRSDLDQVIDVLHGAKRADPRQPVLVAGDPEMATRAERLEQGVPIPDDLMDPAPRRGRGRRRPLRPRVEPSPLRGEGRVRGGQG